MKLIQEENKMEEQINFHKKEEYTPIKDVSLITIRAILDSANYNVNKDEIYAMAAAEYYIEKLRGQSESLTSMELERNGLEKSLNCVNQILSLKDEEWSAENNYLIKFYHWANDKNNFIK